MSITKVGTIISTHGLKGFVKVFSEIGSFKEMLLNGKIFDKNHAVFQVISCKITGKQDVYRIQIKGIESIDEAKKNVKMELFANTEDFIKKGEILVSDLMGLKVLCITESEKIEIGIVSGIVNYGRGNMMEITCKTKGTKISQVYPATFDFIKEINLLEKYLILKNHHVDILI